MRVAAAGNACLSIRSGGSGVKRQEVENGERDREFRPPDAAITASVSASLSMRKAKRDLVDMRNFRDTQISWKVSLCKSALRDEARLAALHHRELKNANAALLLNEIST